MELIEHKIIQGPQIKANSQIHLQTTIKQW